MTSPHPVAFCLYAILMSIARRGNGSVSRAVFQRMQIRRSPQLRVELASDEAPTWAFCGLSRGDRDLVYGLGGMAGAPFCRARAGGVGGWPLFRGPCGTHLGSDRDQRSCAAHQARRPASQGGGPVSGQLDQGRAGPRPERLVSEPAAVAVPGQGCRDWSPARGSGAPRAGIESSGRPRFPARNFFVPGQDVDGGAGERALTGYHSVATTAGEQVTPEGRRRYLEEDPGLPTVSRFGARSAWAPGRRLSIWIQQARQPVLRGVIGENH